MKVGLISQSCNNAMEFVDLRAKSKLIAGGVFIKTRLQPGAKTEHNRSRFNGFPVG